MTLSDLASLGSFVSGAAVLVTLGFLLAQMRQTGRNQRALMQQGRSAQQVDLLLRLAEPQFSGVRLRSYVCDLAMSDQEVATATCLSEAIWRNLEDGFLQFKGGTIDLASFQSDAAIIGYLFTNPSERALWRLARDRFALEFRDYVDGIMGATKAMRAPPDPDVWRRYAGEELAAIAP
jgi:hypothetical protein